MSERKCNGCRYWSEMVAEAWGCGPVKALCLGRGALKGKMTAGDQSCSEWASNHFGAVDSPPDYGVTACAAYLREHLEAQPADCQNQGQLH